MALSASSQDVRYIDRTTANTTHLVELLRLPLRSVEVVVVEQVALVALVRLDIFPPALNLLQTTLKSMPCGPPICGGTLITTQDTPPVPTLSMCVSIVLT